MNQLIDVAFEEAKILSQIQARITRLRGLLPSEVTKISTGVALFSKLRSACAEDINQLQHAALVLVAAKHLQELYPGELCWFWHPYQTGGIEEPDLRATRNSKVVISAEVTASEKPDGAVDKPMTHTLQKLAAMPGRRFYFVRTEPMRRRAETKVCKSGFAIELVHRELH